MIIYYLVGFDNHDAIFVDVRNHELQDRAQNKIGRTACSQERSALGEWEGVELSHKSKDAR
jgi:hypothetical protein